MHSLNIEAASKHAVDIGSLAPISGGGTSTPLSLNTPDILNSLISITSNPFFGQSPSNAPSSLVTNSSASSGQNGGGGDEDKKVFATLEVPQGPDRGGNSTNPPAIVVVPPPPPSTVQSLRSQFIKDSLKLTIQTKRKHSGKEELDVQAEIVGKVRRREEVEATDNASQATPISNSIENANKLTPEDEERRKRRRERNKIAATKCRNKKKEKTGLLVQESQTLESTNLTLKSSISELEEQRLRLTEILAAHAPLCTMKLGHTNRHAPDSYVPYSPPSSHYYHIQQPTRHHLSAQRS